MACCNNFSRTTNYSCQGCCCAQQPAEEPNYTCACQDNRCFTPMGGWGIFGRRWPLGGIAYTGGICCTCVTDDEVIDI